MQNARQTCSKFCVCLHIRHLRKSNFATYRVRLYTLFGYIIILLSDMSNYVACSR